MRGISINKGGNNNPNAKSSLAKRKTTSGITSYFSEGAAHGAQPSIKTKLQSPKKSRQVD